MLFLAAVGTAVLDPEMIGELSYPLLFVHDRTVSKRCAKICFKIHPEPCPGLRQRTSGRHPPDKVPRL
jgi:hypothetical protein